MMSKRGLVFGLPLAVLLWMVILTVVGSVGAADSLPPTPVLATAVGSIGAADHPPVLPAWQPQAVVIPNTCVSSALACFAEALLAQSPPSSPFGTQAITDSVPYPLMSQQELTIGTDCYLFQSFGGDNIPYATYAAPCDAPTAITRIR